MRAVTHLVAIVLGIAGPVAFTLWSTTDYGPRSRAHYERAAAMRTDARSVLERLVASNYSASAQIIADDERGLILNRDAQGKLTAELFTVANGIVTDRQTLVPQD
jgi:hypothetical protein